MASNKNSYCSSSGNSKSNIKASAGPSPLWNQWGESLGALLVSGGGHQALGTLGWELHPSTICLGHHMALSFSYKDTILHQGPPQRPRLNLITATKKPFPNRCPGLGLQLNFYGSTVPLKHIHPSSSTPIPVKKKCSKNAMCRGDKR